MLGVLATGRRVLNLFNLVSQFSSLGRGCAPRRTVEKSSTTIMHAVIRAVRADLWRGRGGHHAPAPLRMNMNLKFIGLPKNPGQL